MLLWISKLKLGMEKKKKKKPVDENRNKKAISMETKELLIFLPK